LFFFFFKKWISLTPILRTVVLNYCIVVIVVFCIKINDDRIIKCFPHIDFTWAGRIFMSAQVYFVTLFFILSARENETVRDRLTSGKSSLALSVSYFSFCVLKNCQLSHRKSPVFPIRSFIYGGPQQYPPPSAISSRVTSATLALYLATFRPFWRLFFSITGTYWQT